HYSRTAKKQESNGSTQHPLARAVSDALGEVIGAYGLAVISSDFPGVIVGARRGSPLIIGIGDQEHFLASDATAVAPHTRQVVYLEDNDIATITAEAFGVTNSGATSGVKIRQIDFNCAAGEQGD